MPAATVAQTSSRKTEIGSRKGKIDAGRRSSGTVSDRPTQKQDRTGPEKNKSKHNYKNQEMLLHKN
jgi:hypothetical protein